MEAYIQQNIVTNELGTVRDFTGPVTVSLANDVLRDDSSVLRWIPWPGLVDERVSA